LGNCNTARRYTSIWVRTLDSQVKGKIPGVREQGSEGIRGRTWKLNRSLKVNRRRKKQKKLVAIPVSGGQKFGVTKFLHEQRTGKLDVRFVTMLVNGQPLSAVAGQSVTTVNLAYTLTERKKHAGSLCCKNKS
jgi:hypothetical protein